MVRLPLCYYVDYIRITPGHPSARRVSQGLQYVPHGLAVGNGDDGDPSVTRTEFGAVAYVAEFAAAKAGTLEEVDPVVEVRARPAELSFDIDRSYDDGSDLVPPEQLGRSARAVRETYVDADIIDDEPSWCSCEAGR